MTWELRERDGRAWRRLGEFKTKVEADARIDELVADDPRYRDVLYLYWVGLAVETPEKATPPS
jgi:hypothetical protein